MADLDVRNRNVNTATYGSRPASPQTGAVQRRIGSTVRQPAVRATPTGRYSRPAPPPREAPGPVANIGGDIDSYLAGDSGYQQQLRQILKTLTDFGADVTRRRGSLESEYGLSRKALEDQKVKDLDLLEDDYGARGLLRSGLYSKAVGDYETEFGQRMSDLSRKQQEALAALEQEQGQFGSQTELQKQAAREQAIRRRAELLGI